MWAPDIQPVLIEDTTGDIPKAGKQTIYVTSWAVMSARPDDLMDLKPKTIVADEAHLFKSEEALRSQALKFLTDQAKHVLLLSGTPIVNSKDELDTLKTYLKSENPLILRRFLEDVAPDVPPKKRSYLYINLRPKQQSLYDKANQDFEDWLRKEKERLLGEGMAEGEVERAMAAEAFVKIGYLRRIAGEGKVPAAADWIARAVRLGEPVVVFCEHQNVIKKLSKSLRRQRIRHVILDGAATSKQRQAMIDSFQDHKIPVFIGSKAAKEGITLTSARHLLFVERYFTAADEEQSEDRVRRIGQKFPTTIWFLHALGTVDDRIDAIVQTKRQLVQSVLGASTIYETPEGTVKEILHEWEHHAAIQVKPLPLGLGDPLPPLPPPTWTESVVFTGSRWKPEAAVIWCRMNGYWPRKIERRGENDLRLSVHPPDLFARGSFQSDKIAKDIKIIWGKRKSASRSK
jgi:hypothetical protein